jgi:hypothetical protein
MPNSTSKAVKDTGQGTRSARLLVCAHVVANILGCHFRIQVVGYLGMRGNDRFAFRTAALNLASVAVSLSLVKDPGDRKTYPKVNAPDQVRFTDGEFEDSRTFFPRTKLLPAHRSTDGGT